MFKHKLIIALLFVPSLVISEYSLNLSIGPCFGTPQSDPVNVLFLGSVRYTDIPTKPAIFFSIKKPIDNYGVISSGIGVKQASYSGVWTLSSIGYLTTPYEGEAAWIVGMKSSLAETTILLPISFEFYPFKDWGLFFSGNVQLLIVSNAKTKTITEVVKYSDIDQFIEEPSLVIVHSLAIQNKSPEGIRDHDLQFGYGIGWRYRINNFEFTLMAKQLVGRNGITKNNSNESGLGERKDAYLQIGIARIFNLKGT